MSLPPAPTTFTTMPTPTAKPKTTPIPCTETYYAKLTTLLHVPDTLKNEGYKMEGFGAEEILGLRRCGGCHGRIRARKAKAKDKDKDKEKDKEKGEGSGDAAKLQNTQVGSTAKDDEDGVQVTITVSEVTTPSETVETVEKAEEKTGKDAKPKKKKRALCQFHTGRVVNKHFTCCQMHVSDPGCIEKDQHTAIEYAPGKLEAEWMLYSTPANKDTRKAVALDCEMGISIYGEPELIRLSVVDYFTGEILIDSLVYPRVPLQHLNTRYSGVTRGMLESARQRRRCIWGGRDAAREQVWRYVGRETIVVVHGGQSDLLALRWIHERVIDTFVVEGRRTGVVGGRSLKQLAAVLLGEQIQQGQRGHDSVEDALACRGLVDWYVREGLW